MRLFIHILLFFVPFILGAQARVGYLFEEMPEDSLIELNTNVHTAFKPAIRIKSSSESLLKLNGLTDLNYFVDDNSGYKVGLGAEIEGDFNDKWYMRLAAIQGISDGDGMHEPKTFIYSKDSVNALYTDIRSRISFTPNHIFNFQVGLDHNFVGEGVRSLFLSDYGTSYPFGLIRSRFWRIEYSMLYQFMHEKNNKKWNGKFVSSHHLSFNAGKWLNFGVFETVIFQPADSALKRGFDVEYLNPMVFFRPQEYTLGSSDNVLLGASFTAKYQQHSLYGQFIIDEFSLNEIRLKNGWWANKYGGQIGVKGRFKKGNHSFFYRTEYNFVRPYTYSHLSDKFNYGNLGEPLAHPYGANFMELIGELKWQLNRWSAKAFVNYYLQGNDENGYSYGGNIYLPYTFRPSDYNHFIGQGKGFNGAHFMLTGAFKFVKNGAINLFVENHFAYNTLVDKTNYTLVVGIRSLLWNDYRNY